MELEPWLFFAVSVLAIASNAIGIKAIGDTNKTSKQFLIVMLVLSILSLLASGFFIYKMFKM